MPLGRAGDGNDLVRNLVKKFPPELSAKAEESTAESEQAKQRLMAMRQAGQLLLGKLGVAVLSAQEMKTKARPLEEKLIPIATGAPRAP